MIYFSELLKVHQVRNKRPVSRPTFNLLVLQCTGNSVPKHDQWMTLVGFEQTYTMRVRLDCSTPLLYDQRDYGYERLLETWNK